MWSGEDLVALGAKHDAILCLLGGTLLAASLPCSAATPPQKAATLTRPASKIRNITVVAIEGKISPDIIRVRRGDLVRLTFIAKDGTYGVKIPALKVTGKATIAGRATYVIDLGPTKCPSASVPEMNGRLVVWIDQETFFVLKQEQHRLADDQIFTMHEVTQIQYNVSIDPAEFTFTPPAGATVADYRPKPAPTTLPIHSGR